jgi:hypothetical protein
MRFEFQNVRHFADFSVNPGLCKTELGRESDSWAFAIMLALVARTSEMGSRTLTHAAVGSDGENFKGEYLSDCKVDKYLPENLAPFPTFSYSPQSVGTVKLLRCLVCHSCYGLIVV